VFLFCNEHLLLSLAEQTSNVKTSSCQEERLKFIKKKIKEEVKTDVLRDVITFLLCHLVIVLRAVELLHE